MLLLLAFIVETSQPNLDFEVNCAKFWVVELGNEIKVSIS